MKNLILVGAGDSGREILNWLSSQENEFTFKGFIDDNKQDADVISSIDAYQPQANDVFACTLGTPAAKMQVAEKLLNKGAKFINLVHRSAIVLSPIDHVYGLIISPFVYIANQVKLENFVFLNVASSIGHHVLIKEGSTLCAHCDLTGHVEVGKRVFMGSHACVIPSKIIGDDSIIGAGSAVMRNVPPGITVIGVPAKKLM